MRHVLWRRIPLTWARVTFRAVTAIASVDATLTRGLSEALPNDVALVRCAEVPGLQL